MSDSLLQMENVVKSFMNGPEVLTILDGLYIEVDAGEAAVILGESGSGKSTLLNLVGGLDKPDSGSIRIGGQEIPGKTEDELAELRSRKIGYVFQFHYLLNDFDAVENVMLPLYMTGVKKHEASDRAREMLNRVGVEARSTHHPHQLSGGERQRVAVARALINNPDILLADEPTGNLDEHNSRHVEDLIYNLVEELGKTLILVTHDKRLADRGETRYRLHNGRLEAL